jgi:hypothetical protein
MTRATAMGKRPPAGAAGSGLLRRPPLIRRVLRCFVCWPATKLDLDSAEARQGRLELVSNRIASCKQNEGAIRLEATARLWEAKDEMKVALLQLSPAYCH